MKVVSNILFWSTLFWVTNVAQSCLTVYELSSSYEYGDYNFSGASIGDETTSFNTPIFETLQDAMTAASEGGVKPLGRHIGSFTNAISTGIWNLELFGEGTITSSFGFSEVPVGVILGGTGLYLGYEGPYAFAVLSEDPLIIQFSTCGGSGGKKGKKGY